ncbi:MAG TPA: LysR family transcriptional regulator [Citreicella sp.]|nr:LysR family transcriptional regulator [Citreicella sp.]
MNNWDDLRFLVALSKTGTMTAAAKLLGTNTATVSRRIDRLSEALGRPAFIKTSEGWRPSDAVRDLIHVAQNFDGQLQSTLNRQSDEMEAEQVSLNLGCVPVVIALILFPGLTHHANMLRGIKLTISDRLGREGLGENDLVVQFGRPEQGRIVARRAGQMSFRLYQFCDGDTSGDWAGLNDAPNSSPFMAQARTWFDCEPKLKVDNFVALHGLMQVTRLPGPLPDLLARRDPDLVPVQPEANPFVVECWLFYHESRRSDPGMRRAVDWVIHCFEEFGMDAMPKIGRVHA